MKNLDCNQIKIFINLEIIREEDKIKKKNYIYFLKNLKNFCILVKPFGTTIAFKSNFYYIVYDFCKSLKCLKRKIEFVFSTSHAQEVMK